MTYSNLRDKLQESRYEYVQKINELFFDVHNQIDVINHTIFIDHIGQQIIEEIENILNIPHTPGEGVRLGSQGELIPLSAPD
jgi:hypothetical protein